MHIQRSWTPFEGASILLPSGPAKHLFVILTDPCPEGRVALVNISSIEKGRYYDPTCTFVGGEHPFFRRPSYVYYAMAEIRSVLGLQQGVIAKDFIPRESVSAEVFERICDGLCVSDDVPQKVVNYVMARLSSK